jgi:hypothetical protein
MSPEFPPSVHTVLSWSLNFSNSNSGTLSQPTIGESKDGRGEFFDQETLNGRAIYIRFAISPITLDVV